MNRRNSIATGLAALTAVAGIQNAAQAEESKADNPELKKVRELLKAHDDAFTGQNLEGVLALFTSKAVILGTGPGEIWSGHEEIKDAYTHFFADFDKGNQQFTYYAHHGELTSEVGWLLASGEVKAKKAGKDIAFPLNVSITAAKAGGQWKIAALHFSTLSSGKEAK
ncbi:MAG: hypothetical protein EOP86_16930 [Verrucomicrobiaceae bacterium]|nr:MAG: hypothetical protein EOP86_16930 [Verrucomicrobiaceae bacterium]